MRTKLVQLPSQDLLLRTSKSRTGAIRPAPKATFSLLPMFVSKNLLEHKPALFLWVLSTAASTLLVFYGKQFAECWKRA